MSHRVCNRAKVKHDNISSMRPIKQEEKCARRMADSTPWLPLPIPFAARLLKAISCVQNATEMLLKQLSPQEAEPHGRNGFGSTPSIKQQQQQRHQATERNAWLQSIPKGEMASRVGTPFYPG
jgi:hypothetical protein